MSPSEVDARPSGSLTKVEQHGIDYIPEEHRSSRPLNVFWIMFGSAVTFPVILLGWVPVSLGLGWWASFSAIAVGAVIGSLLLVPMALLSPSTGTNNPVSSCPQFGVVGRIVGSVIALVISILFTALSIWTGGDSITATLHRLLGIDNGMGMRTIWYTALTVLVILVAVYGHGMMLFLQKLAAPTAGGLMLVGVFAFAPKFDPSFAGSEYALGGFWPTWVAGAIPTLLAVVGYGLAIGDWTRYISPTRHSNASVAAGTFWGGVVGMGLPALWGAFVATMFANPAGNFIDEVIAMSPAWYVLCLLYIGLASGSAQGTVNMYSTGLDLSSIIPRISRVPGTLFVGISAYALVLAGTFFGDIQAQLIVFLDVLTIPFVAFVTVIAIGFWHHRGQYDNYALQSFVRGESGGKYWFHHGWNYRALTAFVAGTVLGLLGVNDAWYTGPLVPLMGGLGLGFLVTIVVSAAVYIVLLALVPEDPAVYVSSPRVRAMRVSAQGGATAVDGFEPSEAL
ncbi:purine-cytosine permease family protein [Mycolicibacterium sp. Dal123E01]|uniref:purine-cytosine permease family protein n=1 Tax=Mycolicibacterium sp. Dal123E01 TaxID=3457578 RepID=UPI00403EBDEC